MDKLEYQCDDLQREREPLPVPEGPLSRPRAALLFSRSLSRHVEQRDADSLGEYFLWIRARSQFASVIDCISVKNLVDFLFPPALCGFI